MIKFKRSHAILAIIIAALAVYANSLWNGFAYDDVYIIQKNARVHDFTNLRAIWLTPYWPSFGSELGLYRPFAIFMYSLQWAVSGGAPWFFHLANVLLHAGVSVLVFLLAEKLFSQRAAIATALLFAIHPVHTEAVANVVGQNELWAAVGAFGACLIYASRPPGLGLSWSRGLAILALYLMSLLAKESAVGLPGLLVLLDFAQRRVQLDREGVLKYVRSMLGLVAAFTSLLIAYLIVRHQVLGTLGGTDAAPGLPHLREQYRVLNAFRAWPEFLRLMFFPLDLSVDYSPAVIMPVESLTPMVLLGAVLVFAVVALALATPRAPRVGFAAGWFFLTILPVSNLFFPIGVILAERTLYLPSFAACLLGGLAWDALRESSRDVNKRLVYALAIVVVAFFSGRTIVRNPDWDSLLTVWKSLHRDHPESYRAQWVNAVTMWDQGRPDLAERYFQIAYHLWPRDSQMLTEWGNFYLSQQRYDTAAVILERSRDLTPFVPRTQEYLAYAYLHSGRPNEALRTAEHALTLEGPHRSIIYPVMAGAYERLGDFGKAAAAWKSAVELKPGDIWLNWAMRARAEAAVGRKDDALRSAGVALEKTKPGSRPRDTVERLKTAITSDCYPAGGACDALGGWQFAIGTPAAQGDAPR